MERAQNGNFPPGVPPEPARQESARSLPEKIISGFSKLVTDNAEQGWFFARLLVSDRARDPMSIRLSRLTALHSVDVVQSPLK
ncbi:hypothetical protein [Mesorhizobium sp. J428]|uniref:hypothetical protein n=1 Tax=Mesorhizobium sp. J428 TaxID=2898440 RepID=UPI00215124C4|nr:hypothetical protein [Mesorhizobium sp. J428]MCR5859952.1 hypothetical protein [Mesorhizobium sp. J428]